MPTFVFTDIRNSTKMWQLYPNSMPKALAKHDLIVREAVKTTSGSVVKHTGDGFMIVFENGRALECALAIEKALGSENWSEVEELKIRSGIHSGDAVMRGGDYFGNSVNLASRLMSAAWPGQMLLSASAAESELLPSGASLLDEGYHVLKDLMEAEHIFSLSHPDLHNFFPGLDLSFSHNDLPLQPTPFIGRKIELDEIISMITAPECGLVTILGHGGSGKTRIALEAATELKESFKHGVWFVPVENCDSGVSLVSRIVESFSPDLAKSLAEEKHILDFFAQREALLILDNFEHITAHAALISRILEVCSGLKAITTSRRRLGIREETVFELTGMMHTDSTSLFLSSARQVSRKFEPSEDDNRAITGICRILDGSPLGIELAASWVRTISCSELEQELENNLDILESTSDDRPERQQSLQCVFDYSWNLLKPNEQDALAGLSVFEGGFDRDGALEVVGCDLGILQCLIDHSIVKPRVRAGYLLHPLTRQYAEQKQGGLTGGTEALLEKHCKFYQNFLDNFSKMMHGSDQAVALNMISQEYPNIRKGVFHAFTKLDPAKIACYTKTLSTMFQIRSRFAEGIELFSQLYEMLDGSASELSEHSNLVERTRAELKERIGNFLLMSGRTIEAEPYLKSAAEIAAALDDPGLDTLCIGSLGNYAYLKKDWNLAEEQWSRALSAARRAGNPRSISSLLCNLATISRRNGSITEAKIFLEEARQISVETGDVSLNASLQSTIADILRAEGDLDGAEMKYRESLVLSNSIDDLRGASKCLDKLADIVCGRSPEQALDLARKSLSLARESETVSRIVHAGIRLCLVLESNNRIDEAMEQIQVTEAEAYSLNNPSLIASVASARDLVNKRFMETNRTLKEK